MEVTNEAILEFIIKYSQEHTYPPSVQEIGDAMGFKSTSTTWNRLQKMLKIGMIESDNPGAARAIRVPGYILVKTGNPEQEGE